MFEIFLSVISSALVAALVSAFFNNVLALREKRRELYKSFLNDVRLINNEHTLSSIGRVDRVDKLKEHLVEFDLVAGRRTRECVVNYFDFLQHDAKFWQAKELFHARKHNARRFDASKEELSWVYEGDGYATEVLFEKEEELFDKLVKCMVEDLSLMYKLNLMNRDKRWAMGFIAKRVGDGDFIEQSTTQVMTAKEYMQRNQQEQSTKSDAS